ncbi:MAG TPA: carboxypeptidase regulatory-like domain-containing protein [Terriglobales bacterium]|nr:carboxypeptidase regulatory-like domain-containing protein [Terriglobales bacterium]
MHVRFPRGRFLYRSLFVFVALLFTSSLFGQSNATVQGAITDASGAAIPGATVIVTNTATHVTQTVQTDGAGNYQVPALPIGDYDVTVSASGMQKQVAKGLVLQVGRTTTQNFQLKIAQASEVVTVEGSVPVVEQSTMTVGQTISQKTVQEIPLNGRHFVDLATLTPGTVIPPANGFLTAPLRGQGSFGIVSAGQREGTTNFMINGINLNDMANSQVTFQPTIDTVSEFTLDNQTPSAEYGRNSGEVVNIATRSGTNQFHGEAFDFLRNNDLDARNYFNQTGSPMNAFKRNDFGGDLGGPIWKDKAFFFGSYEGLRQRQALALSSSVPTAAQRASATDPNVQKLLALIPAGVPAGNFNAFSGGAVAPVNIDQGTGDIGYNFNDNDRLHGYYVFQRDQRLEPNLSGATIPGGGDARESHRQLFTLNETHVFNPKLVNDFRAGLNRIHITFVSDTQNAGLDPSAFGIQNGLSGPVGIPHISITDEGLQFGGERNFPQGRGDLTTVTSDTVSYLKGNHSFKFGGEWRRFFGNSFTGDEGSLTFSTTAAFLAAQPTAFAITLGSNRPARVSEPAIGLFAMDNYKIKPYLTLELGLRYEWNFTPTEALNRSVLFDPATSSLVQLGTNGFNQEYHQNNKLFEPRLGFAWDVFHNGKTVVRSGYGIMYDQPLPTIFSGNPPFALPISFTSSKAVPNTTFATLLTDAAGSGLAPGNIDPNFNDAYVQSYNFNIQQQITPTLGVMAGYFGSKGTHLEMGLNQNQILPSGVRPFPALAADSPIIPVTPSGTQLTALGNISEDTSNGTSNYNALWITGTKHFSRGFQFDANYVWSKSLDEASQNFEGVTVQNSLNPFADYGPSDFDARHHVTFSGTYELPFKANRLVSGWRFGTILQLQSGNPLSITSGSPKTGATTASFTGIGNLRPDLTGPLSPVGTTILPSGFVQYFSNSVCDPTQAATCTGGQAFTIPVAVVNGTNVYHFGDLSRNSLVGPGFEDVDFSLTKTTKITERLSNEFRIETFDLFNHPNFGNPGLTAQPGSASFGVIRATRNPTGDAGSSRQLQIALKLIF